MRWRLEVSLQVHDEWVVYDGKNFLFALHVVNLLQFDDCTLFEAFQGQWLDIGIVASVLDQTNPTERASAQRGQNVEIIQVQNALLLSGGTIFLLLLCLIVVNYQVL